MLSPILQPEQEAILTEERRHLGDLRVLLGRLGASEEDQKALAQSVAQLDELFLLVVVGEFNAGKSAFINALLGEKILEEGVTPTTRRVHHLRWGSTLKRSLEEEALEVVEAPCRLLTEINVVDTPGTNAIDRRHEALTQEFVPRSDLVLFVTSADRPFTESERVFLAKLRQWGKKIVVVINKIDILASADDLGQVVEFVADGARDLLDFVPEIFPVSARLATGDEDDYRRRFEALESYVASTLDESERVKLKLLNPVGVGLRLIATQRRSCEDRLQMLAQDVETLESLEGQLEEYKTDMEREFRFRLGDVDKLLHQLENRGMSFLDDTLRLARILDLVNKARLEADFASKVVADTPGKIEASVSDIIDWMVSSELRQWQGVMELVNRRQRQGEIEGMVGEVGGGFESSRGHLLKTLGQVAQATVDSYNRNEEASRMAESVQMAVAGTAVLGVGAVGLGAIVTLLATTTAADLTGILAAGAMATLGLLVIPARRKQAKKLLRERIASLRPQLMTGLGEQFEEEIQRSLARIEDAISPYTRFIRAQRQRCRDQREELDTLTGNLERLKGQIEAL